MIQPHKVCPRCGQPAVLQMPACRRCGYAYTSDASAGWSANGPSRGRRRLLVLSLAALCALLLGARISFTIRDLRHAGNLNGPSPGVSPTSPAGQEAPLRPPLGAPGARERHPVWAPPDPTAMPARA